MNKKSFLQMAKFTLISISAAVIQLGSFAVFNDVFKWMYWIAYLVSLILSMIWKLAFNRRYTFRSTSNISIAMVKLFGFYAVFAPISTIFGHMAEYMGMNDYIILGVTMLSNFVLEFLFCKIAVYKNQGNAR